MRNIYDRYRLLVSMWFLSGTLPAVSAEGNGQVSQPVRAAAGWSCPDWQLRQICAYKPYLDLQYLGDRPYAAHVLNASRDPIATNNCCTETSITLMFLKRASWSQSRVSQSVIVLNEKNSLVKMRVLWIQMACYSALFSTWARPEH